MYLKNDKNTGVTLSLHSEVHEYKWSTLKHYVDKANKIFQDQESLRAKTNPVNNFDYSLERSTVQRFEKVNNAGMENAPLVSIVTPAWNRQSEILKAIQSVQSQTYENWELLIVDDGSTDETVKVIKQAQKDDQRIRLYEPGHGGVCKARNVALSHAKGEWVAFLDSDNEWTPHYLKTVISSAVYAKKTAAYSAIKMMNNKEIRYRTTEPDAHLFTIGNYVDLNAFVVKLDVLKSLGFFDESLRRMVDYDLIARISKSVELHYVPIIGVNYTDNSDSDRITTTELVSWDGVVKNNNFIDWNSLQMKKTKNGLTSVIIPVTNDVRSALRAIGSVVRAMKNVSDYEIIIADSSSSAAVNATLGVLPAIDNRICYHRFPASHDNTLGANYGFSVAKGDVVVIVDQRIDMEDANIEKLISAIRDNRTIVGPLQMTVHRTLLSAGVGFRKGDNNPINLLENHPLSDIRELPDNYDVPALAHGCIAMKSTLFAELQGFNPLFDKGFEYQDICLRARRVKAVIEIVKSETIINLNPLKGWGSSSQKTFSEFWNNDEDSISGLLRMAGFDVVQYKTLSQTQGKFSRTEPILKASSAKKDIYRWAIKISAPSDERRFAWGDVYYAEGLRDALEALGQHVAIDYRESHYRTTSYLDDVNVDIRGLDNFQPQVGKYNILWVISHPEKLTKDIVKSFDKVYSAGDKWAHFMAEKTGKPIDFLPQCTDTDIFKPPQTVNPSYSGKPLLVGNSRGLLRPIVRDAIAADFDLNIYGGGWEGIVDSKFVQGTFIPNRQLPEAYGSAPIVLNDHWDDMRKWGFVSNRIFDAVSAGAKVITDNNETVKQLFSDNIVKVYKDVDDLKSIRKSEWYSQPLSVAGKMDNHAFIQKKHSFLARAEKMIQDLGDKR